MNDESPDQRSELRLALQKLSNGAGIERGDLIEALGGELGELQRCWGVNLRNGELAARRTVYANLDSHISRIEPRRAFQKVSVQDRTKQYAYAVKVSFNMLNHPELVGKDLMGRRKWLAEDARGNLKITVRTSRRDLEHAISEIERQVLDSGYTPIPETGLTGRGPLMAEPLGTKDSPSTEDRSLRKALIAPKKRRAIIASATGLALIAALAIIIPNLRDGSAPASHPSSSTAPSATSAAALTATEPVLIEQVGALDTGPNNSFVTPAKLQLSTTQLAQLDSSSLASLEASNAAIPTKSGFISVTMMGNASETVTITGMRVIKQCVAPATGTLFYSPSAGEDTTISLGFDLDSQITYAQDTEAGRNYSGDFFQEHVVTLAPKETQTFAIYVMTVQHYCTFSFELTVATAHGSVTEQVPPRGKPFALTALDPGLSNTPGQQDFAAYKAVYITGQAAMPAVLGFIPVNPNTYKGAGNPQSYPPAQ